MNPDILQSSTGSALRDKLHNLVNSIDDAELLEAMHTLLSRMSTGIVLLPVAFSALHPAVQDSINAGIKDLEEGRTIPHEQVMADMRSRFGLSA